MLKFISLFLFAENINVKKVEIIFQVPQKTCYKENPLTINYA